MGELKWSLQLCPKTKVSNSQSREVKLCSANGRGAVEALGNSSCVSACARARSLSPSLSLFRRHKMRNCRTR